MEITKVECGVLLDGNNNACFFRSLKEGLRQIGHPACRGGYDYFLSLGEWPQSQRGEMVDTLDHMYHIAKLALALQVKIVVYEETKSGIVNSDKPTAFGLMGPGRCVRIVKVKGAAHFNYMEFVDISNTVINTEDECIIQECTKPTDLVPVERPMNWMADKIYVDIAAYRVNISKQLNDTSMSKFHDAWRRHLSVNDDELMKLIGIPKNPYTE